MGISIVVRSMLVTGAAAAVALLSVGSASAAPAAPKPSANCKVPVFSVTTQKAMPGTKITVSGKNFSGCAAQGNPAKPTAVLPVKVGVVTAAKVTKVLASTKTSADGSFSVEVTIPAVDAGGKPKIILAAEAMDPVTKLTYSGVAQVLYSAGGSSTPSSAPATPSPSSSMAPTSVDTPTAVPAGSGGLADPSSPARTGLELGLGTAGLVLLGAGGLAISRRKAGQH